MTLDPLETFTLRAWARRRLVDAGYMTLIDAVDGLQRVALQDGLVETLGADAVQALLSAAFRGAHGAR